jgi:lipopolysaccharide biosynthesis glycosyltransferase
MENKKNLLVTAADKNYINQAKQLFSSAYWNGGWQGDYMLLSHNIPERDLKWFKDKGILIYKCQPITRRGWKLWSNATMDRFYLFTPEFRKWEHILYLDGDIIVRANLKKLADLMGFWAVKDNKWGLCAGINNEKKFLDGGYDLNEKYFNAGVLAFSTDIIKDNTFNDLNHLWREYKKECKFPDQTTLNLYFQKIWKELDSDYNFCPVDYYDYHIINNSSATILHFKVPKKPWENKKSHFYPEWKKSLGRADGIDLSVIQKWKKEKNLLRKFKRISEKLSKDKFGSQMGVFLKKINPKLYRKLGGKN